MKAQDQPTIFLDIDGVLNTWSVEGPKHEQMRWVDSAMAALRRVCLEVPDLQVVISSTWRKTIIGAPAWQMVLASHGVACTVVGTTPTAMPANWGRPRYNPTSLAPCRGDLISVWLRDHPQVTDYAVVDDDPDAGHGHDWRFVCTNGDVGLTMADAERLLRMFA